jgi:hypothetical protein
LNKGTDSELNAQVSKKTTTGILFRGDCLEEGRISEQATLLPDVHFILKHKKDLQVNQFQKK